MKNIKLSEEEYKERFLIGGKIEFSDIPLETNEHLKIGNHIWKYNNGKIEICRFQEKSGDFIIPFPKNNYDYIAAINACADPRIPLVSLIGPAGTGKTSCAMASAAMIHQDNCCPIILIKENCPSTDYPLGFLKGTIDEKRQPLFDYVYGIIDFINTYANRSKFKSIHEDDVQIETPAFILGKTFSDCVVIVDEAQNINPQIIDLLVTRVGRNCKMIFVGDSDQGYNIKSKFKMNGLTYLNNIMTGSDMFSSVALEVSDLRSPLVKEFLTRKKEYFEGIK